MPRITRAILSCHDKAGVVELAQLLRAYDVEIISTAGTMEVLQEAGVEVRSIADFTGVPEMMEGRVKSLHPKVHAGLLGVRDSKLHSEQLQSNNYEWVDMVVVNLHPVENVVQVPGITLDEVVEQIDIGGNAMIRSAAKNFRYVTVVVNPDRYPTLMHEIQANDGSVNYATRYRLAQEAFECTAQYNQVIADYMRSAEPGEE
jgi:phosphoribosylaminoimidazolecarboxamide formyltransferase/IMP cyclohydrolase